MARRIQKGHLELPQQKTRLLGKNRNAPAPLHLVRIQEGILMVHPAQPAHASRQKKKALRQRGFPGIHMGDNSRAYMF